ncbi:MAG: hypothetical protein A2583_09760 [Bdellovibrionales bacterium RIFOXYD1_FULL_53_11]|nr:MAG: hypothetical protein A2583_09760 [Bdellovibrionales bacterium RIFOXYD1_FULL_53_11]
MTPQLLNQKIESLRNCIQRIEGKLPFAAGQLETDFDLQDIISVNLERAVQICVDIAGKVLAGSSGPSPATMCESFALLAQEGVIPQSIALGMRKSVGLCNMLVHEYSKINWKIVHDVCHLHLGVFRDFAAAVISKTGK